MGFGRVKKSSFRLRIKIYKQQKIMTRIKKEKRNRLRSKYRFSIFNDTSHEELFVFRANGLMMLISISLSIIMIILLVTTLISYTPLREFIPGYPNAQTRRAIVLMP